MRGLGIVGADAPLRPGSGALRTSARSTFPSGPPEGGDGGSNSLAGVSMVPPGRWGRGLGDCGRQKAYNFLWCWIALSHPRRGRRKKPGASRRHTLPCPPYPLFV